MTSNGGHTPVLTTELGGGTFSSMRRMTSIYTRSEGGVMESLFVILFALLESNFISIHFLQNWTEKLIDISKSPPDWLFDLTMCSDSNEALNVLRKNLALSGETLDDEYGGILVGFFYLSYMNKKISFQKLRYEILDVIDAYEIENLDIEEMVPLFKTEQGDIEGLFLKRFEKYGKKSNVLYSYLISQVDRVGI